MGIFFVPRAARSSGTHGKSTLSTVREGKGLEEGKEDGKKFAGSEEVGTRHHA